MHWLLACAGLALVAHFATRTPKRVPAPASTGGFVSPPATTTIAPNPTGTIISPPAPTPFPTSTKSAALARFAAIDAAGDWTEGDNHGLHLVMGGAVGQPGTYNATLAGNKWNQKFGGSKAILNQS